jgi:hypothetical protein
VSRPVFQVTHNFARNPRQSYNCKSINSQSLQMLVTSQIRSNMNLISSPVAARRNSESRSAFRFKLTARKCVSWVTLWLIDLPERSTVIRGFRRDLTNPAHRISLVHFRIENHVSAFAEGADAWIVEVSFRLLPTGVPKSTTIANTVPVENVD